MTVDPKAFQGDKLQLLRAEVPKLARALLDAKDDARTRVVQKTGQILNMCGAAQDAIRDQYGTFFTDVITAYAKADDDGVPAVHTDVDVAAAILNCEVISKAAEFG
eukprot:6971899-Pyramimonas_sp.AAC.1